MKSLVEGFNEVRGQSGGAGGGDILLMNFGIISQAKMEKAHIVSVPCQEDPDLPILSLTCFDQFKDVKFIQPLEVSVIAQCPDPADCAGEDPQIEGQEEHYSANSQVCRSAQHAGKMKKYGGG